MDCCLHRDSLVLLAVVSQDEIFELHLNLHPLLIGEGGPDVVSLCHCCLVWLQQDLRLVVVHVQSTQDQDQTRESL